MPDLNYAQQIDEEDHQNRLGTIPNHQSTDTSQEISNH